MYYQQFSIPASLLADLYKDNLVLIEGEHDTRKKNLAHQPLQMAEKQWFLGDNKQNMTIIINDPDSVFIAEDHLSVLSRILAACKLTIADVAIINTANSNKPMTEIKEILAPRYCLFFGVNPSLLLPFMFPQYKLQKYSECTYLWADGLDVLMPDDQNAKTLKRQLWDCLKEMFNL